MGWYHAQWWTEEFSKDILSQCNDSFLEPFIINRTIAILQTNSAPDEYAETDVNLVSVKPENIVIIKGPIKRDYVLAI